MKSILLLVGTRPEIIKIAPVYFALIKYKIPVRLYTTGQHTDLIQLASSIFNIIPESLGPLAASKDLEHATAQLLERARTIIQLVKPGLVIVHGDTATAFAGALTAFYNQIPVGHVEAGLRTNDMQQPFPEEFNRQAIARIAALHFAPTVLAKQNLLAENVVGDVVVTGNTIVDALLYVVHMIKENPMCIAQKINSLVRSILAEHKKIILITLHRRELFLSNNYEKILKALIKYAQLHRHVVVLFITHPNPVIQKIIHAYRAQVPSNFYWLQPLEYQDLIYCLLNAHCVVTDSGGITEEAAVLQCPTILLRKKTERPEACAAGIATLVGYEYDKLLQKLTELVAQPKKEQHIDTTLYGNGTAADKIVYYLIEYLNHAKKQ